MIGGERAVRQPRTSTSSASRPPPTARSGCAATRASSPTSAVRQALALHASTASRWSNAVQGQGRRRQRPRDRPDLPVLRRRRCRSATQRHRQGQAAARRRRLPRRPHGDAPLRRPAGDPAAGAADPGAGAGGRLHARARRSRAWTRSTARSGARPSRPTRRAPAPPSSASSTTATAPRPTCTSTPRSSTNGIWNSSQYSSPEFDAAFAAYQAAIGVDAQKAACKKIEEILVEDMPIGVPYFYNYIAGCSKKFQGVRVEALGQMFLDKASQVPDAMATAGTRAPRASRPDRTRGVTSDGSPMTRYVLRRLAAVARHVVAARHDRVHDRQRLPERRRADHRRAVRVAGDRRRRSTRGSGTNDPLLVQYGRLLKSMVTFDFGDSYQSRTSRSCRGDRRGVLALGQAGRLALRPDDPAQHRRRHVRRPTTGKAADRAVVHARPRQLVDPGVRLGRDPAVSSIGVKLGLVPRARPTPPAAPASSRSSAT